jgi:hypothetical protein
MINKKKELAETAKKTKHTVILFCLFKILENGFSFRTPRQSLFPSGNHFFPHFSEITQKPQVFNFLKT